MYIYYGIMHAWYACHTSHVHQCVLKEPKTMQLFPHVLHNLLSDLQAYSQFNVWVILFNKESTTTTREMFSQNNVSIKTLSISMYKNVICIGSHTIGTLMSLNKQSSYLIANLDYTDRCFPHFISILFVYYFPASRITS